MDVGEHDGGCDGSDVVGKEGVRGRARETINGRVIGRNGRHERGKTGEQSNERGREGAGGLGS